MHRPGLREGTPAAFKLANNYRHSGIKPHQRQQTDACCENCRHVVLRYFMCELMRNDEYLSQVVRPLSVCRRFEGEK